ncbi:MAG: ABC transporter ATP-binding protein [Anaerolineaceae bacterium]|nr:ABC transporter ATP-binding protein [Anaerolineaceae bacterium]
MALSEHIDLKPLLSKNRLIGLWNLMKGFHARYISAAFFIGFAAAAKTSTYLLLSYFVDSFFTEKAANVSLGWIAAGFVGLAFIEGGFSFLGNSFAAKTAEGTIKRLRNYIYDQIQNLPFTFHDLTDTGELIQKATSDIDVIRRFFAEQAIAFGRILLLFLINFLAIYFINPKLALLSILIVPIVITISIFFFKRISKAYEAYQEQEAVLSTRLQENLTGVRVVKAFARQSHEISKFIRENWEKFLRGKKLITMHSLYWPITDILCGFQIVFGYYLGAMMVANDEISIGAYIAYMGLLIWIIFPIRNLGRLIVQISSGLVSYQRITSIIKEEREPLEQGDYEPEQEISGAISFQDVTFEYEKGDRVLKSVSFHCQPGQVVAVLGSTGSGKTSLVNLLPRFYEYKGGNILLDGIELNRYSRKTLRNSIGIVEQEPFLFSRSIRDNITLGVNRDVSEEEIHQAAKFAAIHDFILSNTTKGYDTMIGERGVTLSGGQKQRIAIARTILKNPKILILDDSTSSVDTETESEIRQALENLMQNRTTFIIAHRVQSVMSADLIIVLSKGEISQIGTHQDLLKQEGMYKEIYTIQTQIEKEIEEEISSAG